jgi:hypothetical protein
MKFFLILLSLLSTPFFALARQQDSIAPRTEIRRETERTIERIMDDKTYEMTLKNDEPTEFKVSGKVIPPENWSKYADRMKQIRNDALINDAPLIEVKEQYDANGNKVITLDNHKESPTNIIVTEESTTILEGGKSKDDPKKKRTETIEKTIKKHRIIREQTQGASTEQLQAPTTTEAARVMSNSEQRFQEDLETQLVNDGLIKNAGQYSVLLTESEMTVNDKKQPDDVFERYKRFYQERQATANSTCEGCKFTFSLRKK